MIIQNHGLFHNIISGFVHQTKVSVKFSFNIVTDAHNCFIFHEPFITIIKTILTLTIQGGQILCSSAAQSVHIRRCQGVQGIDPYNCDIVPVTKASCSVTASN